MPGKPEKQRKLALGMIHEAALGWELAARSYLSESQNKIAGPFLGEAVKCYRKWGAEGKEAVLGVLYLENQIAPDAFREKEIEMIGVLVSQAAISLENARLFKRVSDLNEELEREIRERKEAETQEARLRTQLQQSQKMEAIGTLAGGIAHDFNNILTAILGFTELSLDDVAPDSELYSNLRQVENAGLRAKELVNQILTFARQSRTEKRPVRISAIIKEALKFMRSSIPATIEIRQGLQSDENVMADPTSIHQIVMNLCTNAASAMKEKGGVLEVTLESTVIEPGLAGQFMELAPGRYLELAVRDTGAGIEPEHLPRIFDPYFTTKGPGEGTGLGLSVVQGIVRDCGGDIRVESQPGIGSTFRVLLPVIERELDGERVFDADSIVPTGSERILVVDDEPGIVEMEKQMLKRMGYGVTGRTDGFEALELFKNKAESFDLVITDLTMPQLTGDQLAEKMLQIRPDIPVILCTGFGETHAANLIRNKKIAAILFKPLLRNELANCLRNILDGGK